MEAETARIEAVDRLAVLAWWLEGGPQCPSPTATSRAGRLILREGLNHVRQRCNGLGLGRRLTLFEKPNGITRAVMTQRAAEAAEKCGEIAGAIRLLKLGIEGAPKLGIIEELRQELARLQSAGGNVDDKDVHRELGG